MLLLQNDMTTAKIMRTSSFMSERQMMRRIVSGVNSILSIEYNTPFAICGRRILCSYMSFLSAHRDREAFS